MASFELLNANVMLKCTQRMPACSCLACLKICFLTISSLVEGRPTNGTKGKVGPSPKWKTKRSSMHFKYLFIRPKETSMMKWTAVKFVHRLLVERTGSLHS